ncbi:hypothetical protein MH1LPH_20030 [Lactiplantibacillus brownii]
MMSIDDNFNQHIVLFGFKIVVQFVRLRGPARSPWGRPAAKRRSAGRFQAETHVLKVGQTLTWAKPPS